jgi:hypothetical protein
MRDILTTDPVSSGRLDEPPDQPPRSSHGKSVIDLATGTEGEGLGMEADNPVIKIMRRAGEARNALLALGAELPQLQPGIQQFIGGLEMAVPQMLADLMSGQPPGMGQTGGGPGVEQAPTAPPTSTAV